MATLDQWMQQQYGATPTYAAPSGEDSNGNQGQFLGYENNTNYYAPSGQDMGKITYGDPWELAKAAGFLGSFAVGGQALGALAGGTGGMFGAGAGLGAGAGTGADVVVGGPMSVGGATGTDLGALGTAGVAPTAGTAGGSSLFSNPMVQKLLGSGASSLLSGGGSGGGSGSGSNLTGIAGLLSGIYGANQQNKAGSGLLDYLKQRQAINDNMYSAGSPELGALQQEMDRKDAAAGRNSQYGPRAVDLAGRIAQLKMNANTQMTTGISKYINDGLTQKANAGANITSMIPGLLGGGSGGSLMQLIQQLGNNTNYSDPSTWNWNGATASPGTGYDTSNSYVPFEDGWEL